MAICKYFLDGRCRFGDRCRFDHPRGQNQGAQRQLFGGEAGGGGGGQRVTFRDSFGTSQNNSQYNQNTSQYKWTAQANKQQKPTVGTPSADIINNLQKEVETWEQSKQWPFSCLSIDRELPCLLPDFEDLSPEELRFEAYTAMKSGNIQTYVTKFQELSQDYSNKRQQLKNANPQLRQTLIQFIDDYRNNKVSGAQSSLFGAGSSGGFGSGGGSFGEGAGGVFGSSSSSSSSIFGGGSTTSGNLFGKAPQSSSSGVFGQSSAGTSVFGSSSSSSAFGEGSTAGGFGGSGTFGGSGGTAFGMSSQSGSFGSSGAQGGFGSDGTNTNFGNAGSSGGFGSGRSDCFGTGVGAGGFGTGSAGTSSSLFGGTGFGSTPATSSFGGSSSTPGGGFGSQLSQSAGPPSGFFSGQAQPTPAATPSPAPGNSKMYTPLADLTEEEKAQFNAPSFVLGKIPTRPPPRELINGAMGR